MKSEGRPLRREEDRLHYWGQEQHANLVTLQNLKEAVRVVHHEPLDLVLIVADQIGMGHVQNNPGTLRPSMQLLSRETNFM